MTASTNVDGPEDADTAIVMTGQWALSSDPRIRAIRNAARPVRRAITDANQVEGAFFVLGRGPPVRVLRRLGEEQLLGSNVDQHVLARVEPFAIGSVALVHFAPRSGDFPRIEPHDVVTLARSGTSDGQALECAREDTAAQLARRKRA
jgi:hypothetical protein